MVFIESNAMSKVSSPEELSKWMKDNIRYHDYTKLMSPKEVFDKKYGSCHDQVMFELQELRSLGIKPKAMFLIEYDPNTNQGGKTHSFVYYTKKDKYIWFENAWRGQEGIHTYDSLKELKDDIKSKFDHSDKYPELQFTSFSNHSPGETLEEFVNKCTS